MSTAAGTLVEEEIADVFSHVPDPSIAPFLEEVRDDAVAAIVELLEAGPEAGVRLEARLDRYRVNVIADRTGLEGAPVVTERFPGRQNLTGSIDRVQDGPMSFRADATTIRGGTLLAADGGYLIVHAVERPAAGRVGGAEAHDRDRRAPRSAPPPRACSACRGRSSRIRSRST